MRQNDPPNKCAKMTRQDILPWQPAGFIRENNPPNLLARKICHFNSRRACQRSPLPCSRSPRLDPARQPSPPPAAPPTEPGGGGKEPARPTHASWTCTFTFIPQFMNGYISLYDTIHTYSTQSGLMWKNKYITVGEGIIARKGWGASLLPAPFKGMFCTIESLQEVSRLAILTRIGHKNIYNAPLYSNEYIYQHRNDITALQTTCTVSSQ